jgi:Family of unknown function (DUF6220)
VIRYLRWAYAITAWLLVGAIVVQFLLAGVGVFAPNNFCGAIPDNTIGCGFTTHAMFAAAVLFPLLLLVLIFAFAARAPLRSKALSLGLLGLFVLQGILIWPYYDAPTEWKPLSALHVVNGILVLYVAFHVAGLAKDLVLQAPLSGETSPSEIVVRPAEAKGE